MRTHSGVSLHSRGCGNAQRERFVGTGETRREAVFVATVNLTADDFELFEDGKPQPITQI